MKKLIFSILGYFVFANMVAQDIVGAWETTFSNEQGATIKQVAIFTKNFVSLAAFEETTGKFMATQGGSYWIEGDNLVQTFEFASQNLDRIGITKKTLFQIVDGQLRINDHTWTQIDDGTPGDLAGAWLISGRKQDGEIVKRDTSGPRKTMKILSGTRFQWIAYNTETKQFMGTGGGTYTTVDGKYTENIGFFSRDDSRVGASLQFDYELKDGDWHHSGLSSKGDPIYEVWSLRNP